MDEQHEAWTHIANAMLLIEGGKTDSAMRRLREARALTRFGKHYRDIKPDEMPAY